MAVPTSVLTTPAGVTLLMAWPVRSTQNRSLSVTPERAMAERLPNPAEVPAPSAKELNVEPAKGVTAPLLVSTARRTRFPESATSSRPPAGSWARPQGDENVAAVPMPFALPIRPLPASTSVVTLVAPGITACTRWLSLTHRMPVALALASSARPRGETKLAEPSSVVVTPVCVRERTRELPLSAA